MATPPANPPRMADFEALDMTSEKDMGSVFFSADEEEDDMFRSLTMLLSNGRSQD